MAALPWSCLVEQLAGFRQVLHFELSCPQHGDWRSAMPLEAESQRAQCPRCGEPYRAAILARGLTRNTVAWVLVSPSLSKNRNVRLCRPRMGRAKSGELASRVIRTANLMLQGQKPAEIAKALSLTSSHFALFARRCKTDIDGEIRRLTINSCALEPAQPTNSESGRPEHQANCAIADAVAS